MLTLDDEERSWRLEARMHAINIVWMKIWCRNLNVWSSNDHIANWDSLPTLKNFWMRMFYGQLACMAGPQDDMKLWMIKIKKDYRMRLFFLDKYYLMWLSFLLNRLINGLALLSLFLAIFSYHGFTMAFVMVPFWCTPCLIWNLLLTI